VPKASRLSGGSGGSSPRASTAVLNVLIASPLEPEFAARIAAADPRIRLLYAPELLPVPRYRCDHGGIKRDLSAAELARWSRLRAVADVSFDFDWQAVDQIPANCPRLRWIQGTSAGIGGLLERTGLIDTPIVFTTAAGVHGVPLAEFALFGLLYFAKGGPVLHDWQSRRHWQRHTTRQLRGSQVVLVGLGGVGRQVAALLDAVGIEVTGVGRPGRSYQVPGVRSYADDTQLAQVLPGADALVLACPLTERTRGLIGRAELAALPAGAVLVNLSRGQVVDEAALIDLLDSGQIGGACLDVFETEPLPESSPLWAMPNVLISPHSASTVSAENELLTELFIENLKRWLAGQPLRNTFDVTAGY